MKVMNSLVSEYPGVMNIVNGLRAPARIDQISLSCSNSQTPGHLKNGRQRNGTGSLFTRCMWSLLFAKTRQTRRPRVTSTDGC